jgi:folate-dependent tRNA-U54 methylase TrmFO/GidA
MAGRPRKSEQDEPKPQNGENKPAAASNVAGLLEVEKLPGPFTNKVVKLIEKNALGIVSHAIEKANENDFRAMKLVFDLLERFEDDIPEEEQNSLAKVLLKHLGLTEEMIAAEQRAFEDGEDPDKISPPRAADADRVK